MAGIEVICAGFDDLEIYDNNKEARDKLVDIIKYENKVSIEQRGLFDRCSFQYILEIVLHHA